MGKVMLPYVEKNVARGRVYYRYRRGGTRIPLPNDPTSQEFAEAYKKAHDSCEVAFRSMTPGSIADVVASMRASPEFKALRQSTIKNYRIYLDEIVEKFGRFPISGFTRRVALAWRDKMSANPARANQAMATLRRLMSFAHDRGLIAANPVLRTHRIKGGVYETWGEDALNAFRKNAPSHLVLALELALYTGQRQGDVIRMTWAQIKDGGIEVVQQKTGARLWVPLHTKLRAALSAAPRTAVTIVTTKEGRPFKQDHFKHEWGKASKAAGITGLVFHGLRKTAASHMAEAGCTTEQIKAITGHTTDAMVAHYVAGANQRIMASAAMKKLELCPTRPARIAQQLPNMKQKIM